MWSPLVLCLLVAGTAIASSDNSNARAWKQGQVYEYQIHGRTLAALHDVADQYTGTLIKATLKVQQRNQDSAIAWITNAKISDIHANLTDGWKSEIPDKYLNYQNWQMNEKPFAISFKNGVVRSLSVNQNIPTWELNIIKSIVSQLQVDTKAENMVSSRLNQKPRNNKPFGTFKTMEDTVTGECETLYDIKPLQPVEHQNKPQLAPMPNLKGSNGDLIDIVKTKNFSRCDSRVEYHFGIPGSNNVEPSSNHAAKFFARSSNSRVILSGDLEQYTIQSSVTTDKIVISPELYNKQKGMVVSRMNVTLSNVHSASSNSAPSMPSNLNKVDDLVYEYLPASESNESAQNNNNNNKNNNRNNNSDDSSSSSSSSSDSSSSSSDSSSSSSSSDSSSSSSSSSSDSSSSSSESSESNQRGNNNRNSNNKDNRNNNNNSSGRRSRRSVLTNQRDNSDEYKNRHNKNENRDDKHNKNNNNKDDESDKDNNRHNMNNNRDDKHNKNNGNNDNNDYDYDNNNHYNHNKKNGRNNKKHNNQDSSSSSSSSSDSSSSSSSESGSDSSSSGSSEEYWQSKPNLNKAPNSPFLPFFIGNKGNSIQSSKQIDGTSAVKSLAQQIGNEIQDPNTLHEHKTLSKFSILCGVIRTMNARQLESATHDLYYQNNKASQSSSSDATKLGAWKAYRDAVAQAGTGPALMTIKQWIQSGKVEGEEAAELLAVLPNTARYPTREYVKELFDLAMNSQVNKQSYLNTTAILAATNLARKAQVDKHSSHNQYPVHAFGPLASKNSKDVTEKYVPYLASKLREALRNEDSLKAQVYIRALGNLAHPMILSVFKPYLEGKSSATNYQRLAMVAAMDKATKVAPKAVQPALFNIYLNTGESHELRCAAVFQLMKTNPSAQLLQRMAAFTEQDMSKQVNSAVKSAIESTAECKTPELQQLAQNARAAKKMLSSKTHGLQYSKNYLSSYAMKEENLAYAQRFSTIGSQDSLMPQSVSYSMKRILGGIKMEKDRLKAMTSSVSDLLGLLENQFSTEESRRQEKNNKQSSSNKDSYSTEKIADMLNIKREQAEQVEAQILATIFGGERFIALDNHTIEKIPRAFKAAAAKLQNGQSFNYTKLYNNYVINIGFPTAMGLPFQFTYKKTNLVSAGGEIRVRTHPNALNGNEHEVIVPDTANVTAEAQLLFATKGQSKISFITPHNQQRYIAGVNNFVQVNLPIKASADVDLVNNQVQFKIEPLNNNKNNHNNNEEKILIASQHPYTTIHNILTLSPAEKGQNVKDINVRRPREWTETYGEASTGVAMKVHYEGEDKSADISTLYKKMQDHDLTTLAFFTHAHAEINRNRFIVSYDAQKSSAKAVKIYMSYKDNEEYRLKNSDKNSNSNDNSNNGQVEARASSAIPSSASRSGAEKRQEELLHKASSGIKDAEAAVVECMVEFQGNNNAQFVATAALANSPVDKNSKFLFYYQASPARSSKFEMAIAASAQVPQLSEMNFAKSQNEEPSININAEAMWGENAQSGAQVSIKAKLEQSEQRKNFIANSPQAQQCRRQMEQQRDYALPACRNITSRSNALDEYSFIIKYEKIPQKLVNATYQMYRVARYAGFPYNSENIVDVSNQANTLKLKVKFDETHKSCNVSIEAPHANAHFKNVPVHPMAKPFIVQNAQYDLDEVVGYSAFRGQYQPTCVADASSAQTFDNKTYPLNLEKDSWYVLLTTAPKQRKHAKFDYKTQRQNNVTVLVKQSGDNKKDVKIILENGQHVIDLQADKSSSSNNDANVRCQVDKKDQRASRNSVNEVTDNQNQRIAQIYALPSGEAVIYIPDSELTINYDGSRVMIEANDRFRDGVRGLCGSFTGEKSTDFITPRNCILRDAKDFINAYSLSNNNKDNSRQSNQDFCPTLRQVQYQEVINEKNTGSWSEGKRLRLQSFFGMFGNNDSDNNRSNDDGNNSNNRRNWSGNGDNNNKNNGHNNDNNSGNNNDSYEQNSNGSSSHRVLVNEEGNQICFSSKSQRQCNQGYRAENTSNKKIDFYCIENGQLANQWKELANKGERVPAQKKNANKTINVEVPTKCVSA